MDVTGNRERRVGFHTFGCKLNQFETEALASSFRRQGFSIVAMGQEADAYVINTCTVTSRADHKARAFIRALARSRPRALLIVTGCSAQLEGQSLAALARNVFVVPQAEKARLLDLPAVLAQAGNGRERLPLPGESPSGARPDPFSLTVGEHSFHTRAFLKVQDGCDSRCSYCRVPQARGPSVSLDAAEAARRAAGLEELGYHEIVITGVNISAYSSAGVRLPALLQRLLEATGRARFRLSSLEPEAITESLAEVLSHPRICPHFHIPVQSGADTILGRMNRHYQAGRVIEAVTLLRASKPDPFLAADIIVGFPGETAEEYGRTRRLVESAAFAALHVFPFSPRPGTAAASLRPATPERVRSQRAREITALGRRLSAAYAQSWIGRDVDVLLEGRGGPKARGVSGNYLKVEVARVPAAENAAGRIARARVTAEGSALFLSFAE